MKLGKIKIPAVSVNGDFSYTQYSSHSSAFNGTFPVSGGRNGTQNFYSSQDMASTEQHIYDSTYVSSTWGYYNSVANSSPVGTDNDFVTNTFSESASGYYWALTMPGSTIGAQYQTDASQAGASGGGNTYNASLYITHEDGNIYEVDGDVIGNTQSGSTSSLNGYTGQATYTITQDNTYYAYNTDTTFYFFDSHTGDNSYPQMGNNREPHPFACTITTTDTTSSTTVFDSTQTTSTFSYPVGATTINRGLTAYTTIPQSQETTTWDYTTFTFEYTVQSTTFSNEAKWGLWDTQTILIPVVDLFHDDWIWVINPAPEFGASGDITDLAFSFDGEYTVDPAVLTPRVFEALLVNPDQTQYSNLQDYSNPIIGFSSLEATRIFTTATGDPIAAITDYNSTTLPMEPVSTLWPVQTTDSLTYEDFTTGLTTYTAPDQLLSAVTVVSPLIYFDRTTIGRSLSWVDSDANAITTILSTDAWIQSTFSTLADVTTTTSYLTTSADANGFFYAGQTWTVDDYIGGLRTSPYFAISDKASSILPDINQFGFGGSTLNAFAPGYAYTSSARVYQIQNSDNDLQANDPPIYRGVGAGVEMPYLKSLFDPEISSSVAGMFSDEAGAYIPFMFYYNSRGVISGASSFTDTDSVTWNFEWDTNGLPQMSVTSCLSGIIDTDTFIDSGSFVNNVYGLGDPVSTIRETISRPPNINRGTVYGGHGQPSVNAITLLLAGAYSTTELSNDINWGSTFYSDWTTVTIPPSVLMAFEATTVYEATSGVANYYVWLFSKYALGTYATT